MLAFVFPFIWPIGTTVRIERTPWITYLLISINVVVFYMCGFHPETVIAKLALHPGGPLYQYVSYAMVHEGSRVGLIHVVINMYFLWIFGSVLENKIKWWRMIPLYILAAVAGGLMHQLFNRGESLYGASAAVYGVIGAYMILYPYSSVRCFFTLLVVVVPIIVKITNVMASFFIFIYWLVMFLVWFMLNYFKFQDDIVSISFSSHVGGLLCGSVLALLFYGFYAFTPEAEEAAAEELELERELTLQLHDHGLVPSAVGRGKGSGDENDAPGTPEWVLVREHLIMGRPLEARQAFIRAIRAGGNVCLPPSAQMELFHAMNKLGTRELATEALELLLRIHPRAENAPQAKMEMARILIDEGRDTPRAAQYIQDYLDTQPPMDLEREAIALRKRIQEQTSAKPKGTTAVFGADEDEKPPDSGVMALDDMEPIAQVLLGEDTQERLRRTSQLFGSPDDSVADLPPAIDPMDLRPKDSPTPSPLADVFISLDTFEEFDRTQLAANQDEEQPSEPPPEESKPSGPVTPHAAEKGKAKAWKSRGATRGADLSASRTNRRKRRQWRGSGDWTPDPDGRFAVIHAPGGRIELSIVMGCVGPLLGMNPESVNHALRRRHGIFREDMNLKDAKHLAKEMLQHGQSVMLVEQGRKTAFQEPVDILTCRDQGSDVQFGSATEIVACKWEDVACMGAGVVSLAPGSPGRTVIDLFLAPSRARLRLWENSFLKMEPGEPNKTMTFGELAARLAPKAEHAIRTGTLEWWLQSGEERPDALFHSLVEYENYLRWHLMAYYAPGRLVATGGNDKK